MLFKKNCASVAIVTACLCCSLITANAQQAATPENASTAQAKNVTLHVFNISGWTLVPSNQEIAEVDAVIVSPPRGTYTTLTIIPGEHEFYVYPFKGRKILLTAKPNKEYYLAVGYNPSKSYSFPLGSDPVLIKLITQEDGYNLQKELEPFQPNN
jgi:hypothetical protein